MAPAGADCLRKTFPAMRAGTLAAQPNQVALPFFFTRPEPRLRRRRLCARRRGACAPRTNSAFFTVFFACADMACAVHAAASPDVRAAMVGVAGTVGVKLSGKSCARVVDSKKNRD